MIAQSIAAVGDVLAGKYRVDQVLGIGGMGMVVAATHLELDQRVALKFMLPGAYDTPESAARFLREARAAGRLNSEHVCRVMDVGRFGNGTPYIVMEYLHGESLATHLRRRGALPVGEAVDLVLQAVEGLAEAHAHGIIHRDLKPDNLFLARRNDGATTVKVLDFGISKLSVSGAVTSTGDIMGSPAYMAPEQMESSKDVDARADIWSIGVVLYQLVVGRLPFDGDTLPMLCMHVVNDEPEAMSASGRELPAGFEAAVMTCLRKLAQDRYADVGALAQALAPFGSVAATASAARISVVLRRIADPRAATSHEFSTVASTLDHAGGADRTATTQAAQPEPVRPSALQGTTLGHTSGQAIERASGAARSPGQRLTTRQALRQRWGLAGAVAAIGVVGLLVVIVWRSGPGPVPVDEPSPVPAAGKVVPALTVEPIVPVAGEPNAPVAGGAVRPPDVAAGSAAAVPSAGSAVLPATASPAAATDRRKRVPARSAGSSAAAASPTAAAGPKAAPVAGTKAAPAAGARPTRDRRGEPADPYTGSAAGSAAPPADDDDKWTHMTHDQGKR